MKLIIITLVFILIVCIELSQTCPNICTCNGKVTLMCKNVNLTPKYLRSLVIPTTYKEIHLIENDLSEISSDVLLPFRHATKLEITRNLIEIIPANTFEKFENLTTLTLNNNNIRELHQDALNGLTNLLHLKLAGNKLTYLYEGIFDKLLSVTSIRLMNNNIKAIPNGVFPSLKNLRDLFVGHNDIEELGERAFQNMTMSRLGLSYNQIKIIPITAFLGFSILYKIMLYYNPLQCNCEDVMMYARDFKHMQNDIWGYCSSPEMLKGKSILTAYLNTDCTMCDLTPCKNQGICHGNKTWFVCYCSDQFKGDICEISICKPEIRYIKKVVQLPSSTVLKYVDIGDKPSKNSSGIEQKAKDLETKLMILYAICSLELVIILCFVGLLIMGKYQDWRLMKKYNKQNSPHILEKFRKHVDGDNVTGKGYISISELIPYSY